MNPITATITSIVQQGSNIVVFVNRSDTGQVQYTFNISCTPTSVQETIQADIDSANSTTIQLSNLQSLIGTSFQTSQATLTAAQASIAAANTASVQPITASLTP